jgi:hypothetical protein
MVMRGETRDAGMRGETGKELEFGKEQWETGSEEDEEMVMGKEQR